MYINNTTELTLSKKRSCKKKIFARKTMMEKQFNVLTCINKYQNVYQMYINNTIELTLSKKTICKKNIRANIDDGKSLMY